MGVSLEPSVRIDAFALLVAGAMAARIDLVGAPSAAVQGLAPTTLAGFYHLG